MLDSAVDDMLCWHSCTLVAVKLGSVRIVQRSTYLFKDPVDGVVYILMAIDFVLFGNLTCMLLPLAIPLCPEEAKA